MSQNDDNWRSGAAADTIRVVIDLLPRFYRSVAGELAQEGDKTVLPVRTHYRVLGILAQYPGTNLTDLAAKLGITKTNASPMVEKLVQEGLVVRIPDPVDRRVHGLTLTDLGKESFSHGMVRLTEGLSQRFALLDDGEGRSLQKALDTLSATLPKLL